MAGSRKRLLLSAEEFNDSEARMARRLRTDFDGAWHHLMNRGAKHEMIFLDDGDRYFFVRLLSQIEERFGMEIHAYCLMGNHYHVLARSQTARLSEAMQWLGFRYSTHFNWSHGFDGSPFRGRFHAVPVRTDEHLVACARYIHRNPIDLGVVRLVDYSWSSLGVFVDQHHRQSWLHADLVLRLSGGPDRYQQFVESENTRADLVVRHEGEVRPGLERLQFDPGTGRGDLRELEVKVVDAIRCEFVEDLDETEHSSRLLIKRLHCLVAVDIYQCPTALLADYYGLGSLASARVMVGRARRSLAEDQVARAVVDSFACGDR